MQRCGGFGGPFCCQVGVLSYTAGLALRPDFYFMHRVGFGNVQTGQNVTCVIPHVISGSNVEQSGKCFVCAQAETHAALDHHAALEAHRTQIHDRVVAVYPKCCTVRILKSRKILHFLTMFF